MDAVRMPHYTPEEKEERNGAIIASVGALEGYCLGYLTAEGPEFKKVLEELTKEGEVII